MKPGSWPSIGLIYLYGVLGSSSLSKIIPLQQDFETHLGTTSAQFALLISLLTIPPAVLAGVGGSLIDRVGARATLIAAALTGAAVNLGYSLSDSLAAFQVLRVIEGCVIVGAYSAAPALIMATAGPERRAPAMAFWSTYTPVGFSLGLWLSSHFAGTEAWRGSYVVHGALFLACAIAGLRLPRPAAPPAAARGGLRMLLGAYTQPGPVRVALTFSALVVMGFGVNAVFPSWYAMARGTDLASASSLLAVLNLAMIAGSLGAGVLLSRGASPTRLLLVVAVVSTVAAGVMFASDGAPVAVVPCLAAWLVCSGVSIAVVTAALPRVVASPTQGAAAAGLLSQMAALTTFVTPLLWLPMLERGQAGGFVVIIAAAWVAALLLLPPAKAPAR